MADETRPPIYFHLIPGAELPPVLELRPFLAVVILECAPSPAWRMQASRWLARCGCLYLCAWGAGCEEFHDDVDTANLEQFDFGEIPADRSILTTWHDQESLEEAMEFAKRSARHPDVDLETTLLLQVADLADEPRIRATWQRAGS